MERILQLDLVCDPLGRPKCSCEGHRSRQRKAKFARSGIFRLRAHSVMILWARKWMVRLAGPSSDPYPGSKSHLPVPSLATNIQRKTRMLPDTFLGGVTLSVVSMAVVFLVLGVLSGIIRLIHNAVALFAFDPAGQAERQSLHQKSEPQPETTQKTEPAVQQAGSLGAASSTVTYSSIDPKKAGAIIAALAVSASGRPEHSSQCHPVAALFLRNTRDSGVWGRSGGPKGVGYFGAYRASQFACEEQPVQAAGD